MAEKNDCPHCHAGDLYYNIAMRRRLLAAVSEIGKPHKILYNLISPLLKNATNIRTVRKDYTCSACNEMAFKCPHCDRWSELSAAPKQGETITCSLCGMQSVFRLD